MYVAAQRVVSPASGARGVNVFKYLHGTPSRAGSAPTAFLPDENPGELVWQDLQLPSPGNRVLSYLDVVAPDEISAEELKSRLGLLKQVMQLAGNPSMATWGPLWIRFGLGMTTIPGRTELAALAGHLVLRLPA